MPPSRRRPDGYAIMAAFLGVAAVISVIGAAESDGVLLRAACLLCSAVFAIATEALWACRPWCVRAVAVVPVACLAGLSLEALSERALRPDLLFWMIVSVVGGCIVVAYVRNRARRLFAAVP